VGYLEEEKIDGYLADTGFRSRDPRFVTAERHRALRGAKPNKRFEVEDFAYGLKKRTCVCPARKPMWLRCARALCSSAEAITWEHYKPVVNRVATELSHAGDGGRVE